MLKHHFYIFEFKYKARANKGACSSYFEAGHIIQLDQWEQLDTLQFAQDVKALLL